MVRSDADEDYVQRLAGFVDERVREVQRSSRPVPARSLAVLAALNIADELFQERQASRRLKQRVRDKSRAVLGYLDQEVKARQPQRN